MATLTVWTISVVGIVVITLLVDIILPQGETNKYIKSVMSIITVLVLLQPLPLLFSGESGVFTSALTSEGEEIKNDEVFLANYYARLARVKEARLTKTLEEAGYENVSVCIFMSGVNNMPSISKVLLNLTNMVIRGSDAHINKIEKIRSIAAAYLQISPEKIEIV